MLQALGEDIVTRTQARFATSTGPDGVRWRDKKRPDGRKTLSGKTGLLYGQIHNTVVGNSAVVLAAMQYAAIHQFGGKFEKPAYSKQVRHRTNARGELLRSKIMNGRGLIFAKDSHKRALTRWFEVAAHSITIPARPFMPVRADGSLYPDEARLILAQIDAWLEG